MVVVETKKNNFGSTLFLNKDNKIHFLKVSGLTMNMLLFMEYIGGLVGWTDKIVIVKEICI